jgi:hypothetical protein
MVPDESGYASAHVHPTRWGAVTRNSDGSWTTLWRIGVEESVADQPVASSAVELLRDDDAGFRASVSSVDDRELELRVDTEQDAMWARYYVLTYKVFGLIDSNLAPIGTIESLPKDWYQPFRDMGEK